MLTIQERENLTKTKEQPLTGFTTRRATKLVTESPPKSALNIECNHFARLTSSESSSGSLPFEYQIWLLASQQPFVKPERPDPQYNTSIWRNVAQHYGITDAESPHRRTSAKDVSKTVSAVYPLNIAMPSRLGNHSFSRFVDDTSIFKDRRHKLVALQRAKTEEKNMRDLRVKSESRVPPIDMLGNIVPPDDFEKHSSYDWTNVMSDDQPQLPRGLAPDMFGNMVKRRPVRMWKLTYQDNRPSILDLIRRREEMSREQQRTGKPVLQPDFISSQTISSNQSP